MIGGMGGIQQSMYSGMGGETGGVRQKMHQFMQSLSPEERQAFHQSQQQGGPPPPPPGLQQQGVMPPPPPQNAGGIGSIGGNNLTSEVRQKFEQFEETLNPQEKQELHQMMQAKRQHMSGFNGMGAG